MNSPNHTTGNAFRCLGTQHIESLNLTVEHYEHNVTGAVHYHLNADNDENVFLVALRTVPMDSKGVAHILEHTALCGSEKYPVRDPFFMMIRRSLNTFMNAFTSSDWTAYPFASKNRKDFDNLLDVYLDAVFFSRLDRLDFLQEGHRVEFEKRDDPETDLVFKGVVYNEMKGAMSSPVSQLWQLLTKYLFPSTTYHYNSGGEPEYIPDLSYEELKSFYKKHYHPSNAIFMTYGNIPAAEHQKTFEQNVLSKFERLEDRIEVGDEKRYFSPVSVEEGYAIDEDSLAGQDKTHIVLGWLLGKSTNLYEMLSANLLSGVLLDNSSSPLRLALETTELGAAPSPLCGLEDSNREMSFMCGIEGSKPEHAEKLESLVVSVLEDVAENGIPQEQVESVLHQLELHQREVGGDGYPYGLQLILAGLSVATHRGDPIEALNLDPVLERLREDIKQPDFIKNLVKSRLLNNPHRVRLTLKPDTKLSEYREQAEKQRLAQIKKDLDEDEINAIIKDAEMLAERQGQHDDPEILPKVTLNDVPATIHIAEGNTQTDKELPVTYYEQGTNGLVYQQLIVELPELTDQQLQYLPYYCSVLTEIGCDKRSYVEVQAWQASVSGGVSAYYSMRGKLDNEQDVKGHFVLSGKALANKQEALTELLVKTFETVSFDESDRIRELIAQKRARMEQSVTGNGHGLAMAAASSHMSPVAKLSHDLNGLAGIKTVKQLDKAIAEAEELDVVVNIFKSIHEKIVKAPRQLLLVSEQQVEKEISETAMSYWQQANIAGFTPLELPEINANIEQMWVTSTQVNFCAKAYKTVPGDHPDSAALGVLGGFMRNGFLHTHIRENGGAYGGGASHDSSIGSFRFYSYRDPRLVETLDDFDRAIDWVLEENHDDRMLEEAILGVIGSMDKPGSPAGEAKQAFHNQLYGRTREKRQEYRERVLAVTLDDLKRVTETYLKSKPASIAVITSASTHEELGDLGMEVINL